MTSQVKVGYSQAMPQVSSTMKRCWHRVNPFPNTQRWMDWWGRMRTGGRTRFIIRNAMVLGLIMVSTQDLFDGRIDMVTVISGHLSGILLGLYSWSSNESRYQNALLAGVNAAPTGQISKI